MRGRTIRLYLVDGVPTGILTAEIINWTGKVITAPRSQLPELAKREEVKRTGIYCLVGPDPDQPERDRVYIGEGDSVLKRLLYHDKDEMKDFWTKTAVVISKDDNITKSHGRYLESRFLALAISAGRASLTNGTSPEVPVLPEPDVADMEYFLEQAQMIFPVLGMNFLQPKPVYTQPIGSTSEQSPQFVISVVGTKAFAIETGGEFVVLKGSTTRKHGTESWTSYRSLRDQLVQEGKLVESESPEYYVFAENVAFSSPSAAGTVVAAANTNGRLSWKVEGTGQSYADWHDAMLTAAAAENSEQDKE
ncbi:MAG: GIY-YIG nuclease family protein [Planctomycetaceae bacterium]|nr:GIY-YIG nuclease family protein [Planctomycetaceae bacterium]